MNDLVKVKDLLKNNIDKSYIDKVYWYASNIYLTEKSIDIHINDTNIVSIDHYAEELKTASLSQLINQKKTKNHKPTLVSSGSFLWINGKLIVTQRTNDAKYSPSAWTTPAGRCDDTPLRTAIRETIEEIQISTKNKNEKWYPSLSETFIKHDQKKNFYNAEIKLPKKYEENMKVVRTWLDKELIEETKLWSFFDKENNTLELRLPLYAQIGEELDYSNPEFHTSTIACTRDDLKKLHTVTAVKKLLDSYVEEKPCQMK